LHRGSEKRVKKIHKTYTQMVSDMFIEHEEVDIVPQLPSSISHKKISTSVQRSHRHIKILKASNDLKLVKIQRENLRLLKNLQKSWRSGSSQQTRNKKFIASSVRFNLTDNNW
jgi:hypothetical protein